MTTTARPRSRWGRSWLAGLVALLALLATGTSTAPAASAAATDDPPPLPCANCHGIELVSRTATGTDGLWKYRLRTDAISWTAIDVYVYATDEYRADPTQDFPSLYLTHGAAERASSWSEPGKGNVPAIVEQSEFEGVVVMPEGGRAGWYTDWLAPTTPVNGVQPRWESFHIDQLVPWVDANFRTIEDDQGDPEQGRAIAGLSMGGFGALSYAARHPDLFSAVGAFSPLPNITDGPVRQVLVANSVTQVFGATIDGQGPSTHEFLADDVTNVFGRYVTLPPNRDWVDNNPQHLAEAGAYAHYDGEMAVYIGAAFGELNPGQPLIGDMPLQPTNIAFHNTLESEGVDHRYCTGLPGLVGNHHWTEWRGDLGDFLDTTYGTTPSACPNGFALDP